MSRRINYAARSGAADDQPDAPEWQLSLLIVCFLLGYLAISLVSPWPLLGAVGIAAVVIYREWEYGRRSRERIGGVGFD